MASGAESKTVSARGAEIRYDVRAAGLPSAVFIPGWACRRGYWDGVLDALGEPGTFVALDLRGHGDSTAGSGPWTMEAFAADVLAVMDAEDLADAVLVGHSMGAAVALEAARLSPDRVRRVVAVDALSHLSTYRANPEDGVAAMVARMREGFAAKVAAMMDPMFSSDPTAGLKERVQAEMGSIDPDVGLPALHSLLTWDMDAALADLDVPVAIVAAKGLMPAEAPEALGGRCDLRPVDLVGHFFLLEQPKETAEELRPLLGP